MTFRSCLIGATWLLLAPFAHAALTIEIVGSGATQIPVAIVPFGGEASLPLPPKIAAAVPLAS